MKSRPTLLARVPDGQGKFPFVPILIKGGKPVPILGATAYYLRYTDQGKRITRALGSDLQQAYLAYANRLIAAEHENLGLPVPATVASTSRRELRRSIIQFLEEREQLGRAWGTIVLYRLALQDFMQSCMKEYLDEIDRADIISYITWIRKNCRKNHIHGNAEGERNRNIVNRLTFLRTFFLHYGIAIPLPRKEWPKPTRTNPDRYSTNDGGDINKLLEVAGENDRDLIHFLLCTGFRRAEVAHACYRDIDFRNGTINVHDKPEYGFQVKDHEQRPIDIPLSDGFLKRMKARRERHATELIFFNQQGKPDLHLLDRIKILAKKAGIKDATLHKFRRTFASDMLKRFSVPTVQQMLGHSDLKTTARYLAAQDMNTPEARKAVGEMWAAVGD